MSKRAAMTDTEMGRLERPAVRVDLVILTVIDADLKVLLIPRKAHPFAGCLALPGGPVQVSHRGKQGENLEDAAHRVLAEDTGLPKNSCFIEQIHTFGRAGRDPRMRVISVAWFALIPPAQTAQIKTGTHPGTPRWFSAKEEVPWLRLAFDHAEILAMGTERIQAKIDHTDIAFALVEETFTVGELRDVYEAISAKSYDARNFRRRVSRMIADGAIEAAPGKRHLGKSRPAQVWRLGRRHTDTP